MCSPGFKELGEILLSKFKWGSTFFKLNEELLSQYAACADGAEVVAVQQRYLAEATREADSEDEDGRILAASLVEWDVVAINLFVLGILGCYTIIFY